MSNGETHRPEISLAKGLESIATTGMGGVAGAVTSFIVDWGCTQIGMELTPDQKTQLIAWLVGIFAVAASGARRYLSNRAKYVKE